MATSINRVPLFSSTSQRILPLEEDARSAARIMGRVVDSLPDAVFLTDLSRRVRYFNHAARQLLGWREADLGQACCDLLRRELPGGCLLQRAMEEGRPVQADTGDACTGKAAPLGRRAQCSASPIFDEQGRVLGAVLMLRLGASTTEASANPVQGEEEDSVPQHRALIDLVSHEVRAPVANIRAGLELLADTEELTAHQLQMLEIITAETARLNNFVERVLDAGLLEEGGISFAAEPVNLIPLLRSRLTSFAGRSRCHVLRLVAPGRLPLARGDADKIEMVLNNLLDNAIKYSPQGGQITLEAGPADEPEFLRVSVSDQGVGIPAEHRHEVFNRFYRLDSGGTSRPWGRGLGLYIAKELVEGQGGRIWVEEAGGQGSKITFTIPRLQEE